MESSGANRLSVRAARAFAAAVALLGFFAATTWLGDGRAGATVATSAEGPDKGLVEEAFSLPIGGSYVTRGGTRWTLAAKGTKASATAGPFGFFTLSWSGARGAGRFDLATTAARDWYTEIAAGGRLVHLLGLGDGGLAITVFKGPAPKRLDDTVVVERMLAALRAAGHRTDAGHRAREHNGAMHLFVNGPSGEPAVVAVGGTRTAQLLWVGAPDERTVAPAPAARTPGR